MPIVTDDDCFYCDKPIGDAPRVKGARADAHRDCVHAKLDKLNPKWRDQVNEGERSHED
jgi:hypothetical protein